MTLGHEQQDGEAGPNSDPHLRLLGHAQNYPLGNYEVGSLHVGLEQARGIVREDEVVWPTGLRSADADVQEPARREYPCIFNKVNVSVKVLRQVWGEQCCFKRF